MQRDTNHDGRPDVWEIYEDGELRRLGYDLDFDGHVDRWDRDEVAERAALEREIQEEEKAKKERAAAEGAAEPSSTGKNADAKTNSASKPGDASKNTEPAKGHVSPRKR
jgi:hypothetical protein